MASSFSTPLAPSPLLAESLLLLSRHHAEKDDATSPTSIGLQGIGDAIRALNTLHRECAQEMTRLHVSMQANIKTPNIAQARAALDKSTKRFDKDKHKKRGSLSLRSVSLEYVHVSYHRFKMGDQFCSTRHPHFDPLNISH